MPLPYQRRLCVSQDAARDIFQQLLGNKYYVNCAASMPEPALRFRQDNIYNVLKETGEHDFGQHIASYKREGRCHDCCHILLSHPFTCMQNNVGIFPLLRETLSGPAVKDKIMPPSVQSTFTILNDLSRDVARTGYFVVFGTENCLSNFVKGWWVIKFWDERQ